MTLRRITSFKDSIGTECYAQGLHTSSSIICIKPVCANAVSSLSSCTLPCCLKHPCSCKVAWPSTASHWREKERTVWDSKEPTWSPPGAGPALQGQHAHCGVLDARACRGRPCRVTSTYSWTHGHSRSFCIVKMHGSLVCGHAIFAKATGT